MDMASSGSDMAGDYSRFFHTFMNAHHPLAGPNGNHPQLPPLPPPLHHQHHPRWRFFAVPTRSFWTKYCLLCTVCGSAATILAGIFLVVAALFRYYTTSIYYFETVPTYIPAILLSICGVSTIAFSCKRNRNIILLRITACWSLVSAALSSVITITTSLIHMNRLQTLRECVYNGKPNPPSCTCIAHTLNIDSIGSGYEPVHYVFENTPDCDVIHGTLYSCLRAVFAISVVAVLLSIFLCMLLYQLIGHERKKAYWSRIRRINSDWSADFIACLARPMPRERSSMMPLVMSPTAVSLPVSMSNGSMLPPQGIYGWEPPPPYEGICQVDDGLAPNSTTNGSVPSPATPAAFVAVPPPPMSNQQHNRISSAITSINNNNNNKPPESFAADPGFPIINANSFSPTITSMEPQLGQLNRATDLQTRYDASASPEFLSHNNNNTNCGDSNASVQIQIQTPPTTKHNEEDPRRSEDMVVECGAVRQGDDDDDSFQAGSNASRGSNRRLGRNFKLKQINSLPNSPILMNVRRFCSFSSGGCERVEGKKAFSVAKLNQDMHMDGDSLNEQKLRLDFIPYQKSLNCTSDSSKLFSDCSEDDELDRL